MWANKRWTRSRGHLVGRSLQSAIQFRKAHERFTVPNCFGVLLRKSGLNRPPSGPESVSHSNFIARSSISFGCFISSHRKWKTVTPGLSPASPNAGQVTSTFGWQKLIQFMPKSLYEKLGLLPLLMFTNVITWKSQFVKLGTVKDWF